MRPKKRHAVYAGSFDPLTIGHLWMIEQGVALFDRLVVAIGINPDKRPGETLLKLHGGPKRTVTREQLDDPAYSYYQRGLGWLPHIESHAASTIADFERAVRINPAYETKVRDHIESAKRILEHEK